MHKWFWRGSAAIVLALAMHPNTECKATETAVAGISVCLEDATPEVIQQAMFNFSNREISVLQRIVEAEMTGQSIECKENVASVVINRVFSEDFPDNICDVVFQNNQFSPIDDNRYWEVEVTQETIDAVDYVLQNGPTTCALFFRVPRHKSTGRSWGDKDFLFEDISGTYYYK